MFFKIIDLIGLDKTLDYLIEIKDLYLKPRKFFKKFSNRKLKDKITQTTLYIIIICGLAYAIVGDITTKELIKISFYGVIVLLSSILILIVSEVIISKITKKKPRYTDMLFFPILIKLFYGPIALLIFDKYVTTENYDWLFWHNIFIVCLVIYVYYYSAFIFHNNWKFILLNVVLNLFFLQSFHFIINQMKIDKYSHFKARYYDMIAEERYEKGKRINAFFIVPIYKIIDLKKDKLISFYVFNTYQNTIYGDTLSIKKYRENIKKNILILDTLNLRFNRNKDFFQKYKRLYMKIDSLITKTDSVPLKNYDYPNIYKKIKVIDTKNNSNFQRVIINLINEDFSNENSVNEDKYNIVLVKKILKLRNDLGSELNEFNDLGDRSFIPLLALKYIYNYRIKRKDNVYPDPDKETK